MYLCPKKKVSLRTKLNQNNDDMKKMRCWVMVVGCWVMVALGVNAQNVREKILLDDGWKFAFGHAADPAKDFGCGTEYFNYLTKANSIHNEGPYAQKFDDAAWQTVTVPHDWVTTQTIETTKPASRLVVKADRTLLKADGRDVAVVTIEVQDAKGRVVPDACPVLTFCLEGAGHILGAGNGDPSYLGDDHPRQQDCREFTIPAFNGLAQVLVQSSRQPSSLTLTAQSEGLTYGSVSIVTSPRSE